MKRRTSNIAFVLVGIVILFTSVRSLLHHHHEYYDSIQQIWIPYLFMLFLGAWSVIYGLIGLVRSKRENTE